MLDKLPGFIPEDLRQLISFVPSRGWDAIEWRPLLKQLQRISWQLASQRGVKSLSRKTAALTTAVSLDRRAAAQHLSELDSEQRRAAGDAILRFYFAQWRNPTGIFLDLRPSRFGSTDGETRFTPNGLWAQLDEDFRLGMIDLYRGFYSDDAELLDDALWRMGFLREDLDDEAAQRLRDLLQAHFGVQQEAQHFQIDAFRQSFDALFDFFIEHDYRLRSDFVLVGFYLITLYLVLEHLGQAHDVRALCQMELFEDG